MEDHRNNVIYYANLISEKDLIINPKKKPASMISQRVSITKVYG
jgi:hypothetical protein